MTAAGLSWVTETPLPSRTGGSRDGHGCLGSYMWSRDTFGSQSQLRNGDTRHQLLRWEGMRATFRPSPERGYLHQSCTYDILVRHWCGGLGPARFP